MAMKKRSASRSAFFNPRVLIGFVLCSIGVSLAFVGWSKSATDSLGNPVLKTGISATTPNSQTPGTWTATGSMTTSRVSHTATLLPNGKILVAGGHDSAGTDFSSAELYDLGTGVWISTGSMTTPRQGHIAILLPNGKVLVAGGTIAGCTATGTAELYDPATGTWSGTGSMNDPRSNSLAVMITVGPLTGMVLVAGGDPACGGGPATAVAEVYDPNTGNWSGTNSMGTARDWANSALPALPDGSILAVGGGTCCPYRWFNTAESFDPVNQSWTPTAPKNTNAQGAAVLMQNGVVLVAGGRKGNQGNSDSVADAELFDATGTWIATADMSTDRFLQTLTLLESGQVLTAGGLSGGFGSCSDITSAELYDSTAGIWFPTGNMTVARYLHTATMLPNGQVLAAGGTDCEGNVLSSAELYTPPPVAALSTASLLFGLQLVGTRSAAQTATLTNTGTTTLTISSIAASGDFVAKDNCGSSLPAGASCTIRVAFSPSDTGVRSGAVAITDDAANSPQTIALTGTGTVVALSPASVNFGHQKVGTISRPQTVTLTNTGITPLSIRGIGIVGRNFSDFIETTTCGSSVPANSSCTIDVRFAPTATGPRTASIKVQHDGGGEQPIKLTGIGVSN